MDKKDFEKIQKLDTEEFVRAIYRQILLREADEVGLKNHVDIITNGMSRERVIFEIRLSEEGIKKNVGINGFSIRTIELDRLLDFDGDKFIDAAYIAILGRCPDGGGRETYLNNLRHCTMNKLDVLYEIRHSEEGNGIGVEIVGLESKYKKRKIIRDLYLVPVVGRCARFIHNMLTINQKINYCIDDMNQRMKCIEAQIEGIGQRLGGIDCMMSCVQEKVRNVEDESETIVSKEMSSEVYRTFKLLCSLSKEE